MTKNKFSPPTQNEEFKGFFKSFGSNLHRIRHLHHLRRAQCRNLRRLNINTYLSWEDPCLSEESVGSCSPTSSAKLRGLNTETEANSCGCPPGFCRCRPKTPVHVPHLDLAMRMADSIDQCECPAYYCRCEESISTCFSSNSLEQQQGVSIAGEYGRCRCPPVFCRCEPKTPVHSPYRSIKMQMADPNDRCECPLYYCSCKEAIGTSFSSNSMELRGVAIAGEDGRCRCPPGFCRCEPKTPVHDPLRTLKMRTAGYGNQCECPPGFCRCPRFAGVGSIPIALF